MPERPVEVLLVEDDVELAEMIEHCLQDVMPCRVTHVVSVADALREELTTNHDVVLASMTFPDGDGLELTRGLRPTNSCPVILMAEDLTAERALEALRLRVTDLLIKPFDLAQMAETMREAAQREVRRRRDQLRSRRLRRVATRIIRERRDLRQRMDLICQDLVHAYRRLAQKVTESGMLTHQIHE